jgi:hypothetical protein
MEATGDADSRACPERRPETSDVSRLCFPECAAAVSKAIEPGGVHRATGGTSTWPRTAPGPNSSEQRILGYELGDPEEELVREQEVVERTATG